ncbi:MAG: hypothetical protein AB8H79_11160 [Myxococcota bacterium]
MNTHILHATFLLALVACAGDGGTGGTGGTGNADTELEAAFCDILATGPEESVRAANTVTEAPEVFIDGSKVEIALEPGATLVTFTPDEVGSFAIGLGSNDTFVVRDVNGNEPELLQTVTGASCPELAVRYTYDLKAETYSIDFSGASVDEIELVAEESDDDL